MTSASDEQLAECQSRAVKTACEPYLELGLPDVCRIRVRHIF